MRKKCTICGEGAAYEIKGGTAFYCEECARDNFNDVSFLVKVEEEAQRLKELVKEKDVL